MLNDDIKVGDVISFGAHPSVSPELVGKFWRVKAIEPCAISLDGPYNDKAATERYRPIPPRRGQGVA